MLRRPFLPVVLPLLAAAAAWGADEPSKAPKADYPWVGIVVAVVLVLGVFAASMTGSKRGHQD